MRALRFHSFGSPSSVLKFEEIPTPTERDGELLVQVRAAAINLGIPLVWVVRTTGDPRALANAVQRELLSCFPENFKPGYSHLRATIGLTRDARHRGIDVARRAAIASTRRLVEKVSGSFAATPKRTLRRTRAEMRANGPPITRPIMSKARLSRANKPATSLR